jgi:hypothetical protein
MTSVRQLDDKNIELEEAGPQYKKSTIAIDRNIEGVYIPSEKSEILEVLAFANSLGKKVWPISSGKNWGYGSSLPVTHDNIILDLGLLNKISDFDEVNGIITLGPGVTQGQLYEFLEGTDFIVPITGAGPTVSVLGNLLERGYGLAPIQDHFSALVSMKAYLASGEEYNTSLTEVVGDKLGKKFKWGIGPYLNGIFTQSNFGIVTEVTIQLGRKAKHMELVKLSFDDSSLKDVVACIKDLLAHYPSMLSGINLMNKDRMLSMDVKDPADWTGVFSINIDKEIASFIKKMIKKKLKSKAKILFISKKKLDLISYLPLPAKIKSDLENAKEMFGIFNGKPTQAALKLCYIKHNGEKKTLNPAMDECGLIWYSPLVEMDGEEVVNYVKFVKRICAKYNMEAIVTLTSLNHVLFDSTIPILFSRKDENNGTLNAHNCYNDLLEEGRRLGYYPYRMGVGHMDQLTKNADGFFSIAGKIKDALDPNGVIAPKRYSKV